MINSEKNGVEYLAVRDIRAIYGLSEAAVWRWTKEGRFPKPVRIGTRWTRWLKSEVEAFINSNRKLGA